MTQLLTRRLLAASPLALLLLLAPHTAGAATSGDWLVSYADTVAPSVRIVMPTYGSSVHGSANVLVSSWDNQGVAKVELYADNTLIGTDNTAPYSFTWLTDTGTGGGSHTLIAKAYDAAGNTTNSAPVVVTVDNQPPTVSILSPADSTIVTATTTVTATAQDSDGISRVDFYVDDALKGTAITAPYNFSWKPDLAMGGKHVLTARAYDLAGNMTTSDAVDVTVDLPPAVYLTAPRAGATVKGTVSVTTGAWDAVGLQKVEFYLDGTLTATANSAPYNWTWDTTAAANGVHSLIAKAYDLVGNVTASPAAAVTVDNLAPTVTIAAPVDGSTMTGVTTIVANANDENRVSKVEFYLDGSLAVTRTAAPYNCYWNTALYTDGPHTIDVKAYDMAGNVSTATATVTVDTPPPVNLIPPAAGTLLRGTVSIGADATDTKAVTRVEFYMDGKLMETARTSPYRWDWNTATASNGTHMLTARAYDNGGNVTTSSAIAVIVDNLPPQVTITAPPDQSDVHGVVNVGVYSLDNRAVTKVEFLLDGNVVSTDLARPYSWTWNTTESGDLPHTLQARAYDEAGNVGTSAPVHVNVDNQPPTVQISSPDPDETVSGTTTVTAVPSDNRGIARVHFYLDGTLQAILTNGPYNWNWQTAQSTGGSHTISVRAYDLAGNEVVSPDLPVTVDLASTVAITAPAAGSALRGTVEVAADAADREGVTKVEFYLDGQLTQTATTGPYTWAWDTTTAVGAPHVLTAKAYDTAGNVTVSAPIYVLVDNQAPGVTIASPIGGSLVRGYVLVSLATPPDAVSADFFVDGQLVGSDKAAPFTWNWNTMALADGSHTISAKVYDRAGNETDATPLTVKLDNAKPVVTITSPADETLMKGYNPISITANASDNDRVTRVDFYLDNVAMSGTTAAPYTWVWNPTPAQNGIHTITARAYDQAGNAALSAPVTVSLDLPAIVSLTGPASGSLLRGSATVTASAWDAIGTDRVEFDLDGTVAFTTSTKPYSWNWDTRTAANGPHTLTAKAYDSGGNVSSSMSLAVNIDNQAPTVHIIAPAGGSDVTGVTTIEANAADNDKIAKVEFYIDDTRMFTMSGAPFKYLWNTADFANGPHTIRAKAYDVAGNVAETSLTVDTDTPPGVTISSPSAGTSLRGTTTVEATVADIARVTKVEFYLDGLLTQTALTSPYRWTWDTTSATDTGHLLTAKAYDDAGNSSTSPAMPVIVDNQAPSVIITAPIANASLQGTVTVATLPRDNRNIARVDFYLDGTLAGTARQTPFNWTWDAGAAAGGTHTLSARVYDAAGNEGVSAPLSVLVDNQGPTVRITGPAAGATVIGTVTVTAAPADNQNVSRVEFYLDGVWRSTAKSGPYAWDWQTATVSSGNHTLIAKAYDTAGNMTASAPVTVFVDLPPTVTLTSVLGGAPQQGQVTVTASASDDEGVTKVEFYLDNALVHTATSEPFTWSWDTTGSADGTHALTAKAYDTAGNVSASRVAYVLVDNQAPTVRIASPAANALLRGAVLVSLITAPDTAKAEFFLDGTLTYTDAAGPFSWSWLTGSAANGSHTLTAKVYDKAGNTATSAPLTVTLDNQSPVVAITSPAANATVKGSASISITAAATDNDQVARVDFYLDGLQIGQATAAPYTLNWAAKSLANGSHTLTVRAYDRAGNVSISAPVGITVDQPPAVIMTSPASGTTVHGTVTISATAWDATGVSKVEFLLDGNLLAADANSPYSLTWDTTTTTNGTHSVTAKVYDTGGNIVTATPVTVTVHN